MSAVGLPAHVGQAVEFALAVVEGSGTLLSVDVVRPTEGLEVVAVGLASRASVANGEPYPPEASVQSLPADFDGPMDIVLALRAAEPGAYDGLGLLLTTQRGHQIQRSYSPTGFRLCVGPSPCPGPPVVDLMQDLDLNEVL